VLSLVRRNSDRQNKPKGVKNTERGTNSPLPLLIYTPKDSRLRFLAPKHTSRLLFPSEVPHSTERLGDRAEASWGQRTSVCPPTQSLHDISLFGYPCQGSNVWQIVHMYEKCLLGVYTCIYYVYKTFCSLCVASVWIWERVTAVQSPLHGAGGVKEARGCWCSLMRRETHGVKSDLCLCGTLDILITTGNMTCCWMNTLQSWCTSKGFTAQCCVSKMNAISKRNEFISITTMKNFIAQVFFYRMTLCSVWRPVTSFAMATNTTALEGPPQWHAGFAGIK